MEEANRKAYAVRFDIPKWKGGGAASTKFSW